MSDYYPQTIDFGPLFRETDPVTSKAAGTSARQWRGEHHQAILDALAKGPAGASGIAARCGLVPHQIGKRLHELAKSGQIVETGRLVTSASGRGEREWRVA
jgi:predicted Rossmann fold nucleotide-binding protein DprA/Smf involved in DNA uptake